MSQPHSIQVDWLLVLRRRTQVVMDAIMALKDHVHDPDALHDARISCRRMEAVLHVCRDVLPKRHVVWLEGHFRQLRHKCNPARDNDVLRKWLKEQTDSTTYDLRKLLKRKRRTDESRIVTLLKWLMRDERLSRHVQALDRTEADTKTNTDKTRFLARRWMDELNHFVKAFPENTRNSRQLHSFRIASKRLRYACEFVTDVIPTVQIEPLMELLKKCQDGLGELHDLDVRQRCLERMLPDVAVQRLHRDVVSEREHLIQAWQQWWTSTLPETAIGSAVSNVLGLFRRGPPANEDHLEPAHTV